MVNFIQRLRIAASVLLRAKGASEQAFLRGLPRTRDQVTDPYRQHAWVYACINVIMRKVSGVPFVIASRVKDEEGSQDELTPSESAVARLFKTVNPTMGPSELWQATVLFLYLQGEAFWLLDLDENRNVVQIWPANPKSATPLLDDNENFIGWKITDHKGRTVPFGRDEVVFFRFLDPNDPLRGLAPIEPAKLAISQDFQAAKHNEALLQNNAVPGGIISVPEVINPAELNRLRREWDQAHEGSTRAGKMGWLMGGMKFEAIGISQKDMDFILGRRFNREEILAVFGVPPAEVGVHEFSNFANAKEQGNKFWNNTLLPLMGLIEETLESKFFLRHFPDTVGFFDLTNVEDLQENLEVKSEVGARLFAMGVPFAEINARLQMGFETDKFAHMQRGWQAFSLVDVGGEEEPAPALPPAGPAPPLPASRIPARRKQREFARDVRAIYTSQTRRAIPRMRDAVADFFEREKAGVLSNIEEHYAALLRDHEKSIGLAMTKWGSRKCAYEALKGFLAMHCKGFEEDVASLIFSIDESTGKLTAVASPLTAQMMEESGQALASVLGLSFDPAAPEVVKALLERKNFLANVSGETFNNIRDKLLISIEKGETVQEASARIREMYDKFSVGRSQTIAQTEMGFAYNKATVETYVQSGIAEHEWLSAGDADVRDSHQIDGQTVKVGERFSNGLLHPNEGGGPPEEVIGCRCTTIPVVEAEAQISVFPRKSPRARPIRRAGGQRTHLCPF